MEPSPSSSTPRPGSSSPQVSRDGGGSHQSPRATQPLAAGAPSRAASPWANPRSGQQPGNTRAAGQLHS
eukprot:9650536-Heterocapsa_arctica.AAC.1